MYGVLVIPMARPARRIGHERMPHTLDMKPRIVPTRAMLLGYHSHSLRQVSNHHWTLKKPRLMPRPLGGGAPRWTLRQAQRLLYRREVRRQLDEVRLRLHSRLRVLQAAARDDADDGLTRQR